MQAKVLPLFGAGAVGFALATGQSWTALAAVKGLAAIGVALLTSKLFVRVE